MKARKEERALRRAIRALERVAKGYAEVAAGCREFDALSMACCFGPSAWARPEMEAAQERGAAAATMAGILREGLGEEKGGAR